MVIFVDTFRVAWCRGAKSWREVIIAAVAHAIDVIIVAANFVEFVPVLRPMPSPPSSSNAGIFGTRAQGKQGREGTSIWGHEGTGASPGEAPH
jgi:hypothetical protein